MTDVQKRSAASSHLYRNNFVVALLLLLPPNVIGFSCSTRMGRSTNLVNPTSPGSDRVVWRPPPPAPLPVPAPQPRRPAMQWPNPHVSCWRCGAVGHKRSECNVNGSYPNTIGLENMALSRPRFSGYNPLTLPKSLPDSHCDKGGTLLRLGRYWSPLKGKWGWGALSKGM